MIFGRRGTADRTRRPRDTLTAATVVASLGGAALVAMSTASSTLLDEEVFFPLPVPVPAEAVPAPSPPSTSAAPSFSKSQRAALARALDRYLDDRSGRLSVSVREVSTGPSFTYGAAVRTATASTVKVDIVIALYLKAQRRDRGLTVAERGLAERAIKVSDNAAATVLWHAIGGTRGLAAAARKLGLRDTDPGPGDAWGSTTTSAADRVRVMAALTTGRSPLTAANRRAVLRMMEDVAPEQAWGVSAAAGDRSAVALKNGWLPRRADGGRWTVDSMGLVPVAGRRYLVAVLSDRHASMGAGISMVEHVSKAVTEALSRSDTR